MIQPLAHFAEVLLVYVFQTVSVVTLFLRTVAQILDTIFQMVLTPVLKFLGKYSTIASPAPPEVPAEEKKKEEVEVGAEFL